MPPMFRNLSIHSKLLALLVVPVAGSVLIAVAGAAGAAGDVRRAVHDRRAVLAAGLAGGVVHELQEERDQTAAWVAGGRRRGGAELLVRRQRVDRAAAAYRSGAAGFGGDPALGRALAAAGQQLDRLPAVRAGTGRRPVALARTLADLDAVVNALFRVERGLVLPLDDPGLARGAGLLLAVARAKEATGQERTVLAAASPGDRLDPEVLARLIGATSVARHELTGVRAAAGGRLDTVDRVLGTPGTATARRLELALLDAAPVLALPQARRGTAQEPPGPADAGDRGAWRTALTARARALRRVELVVGRDLARTAEAAAVGKQTRRRNHLLLLAVVAVAAMAPVPLLLRVRVGLSSPPDLAGGPTLLGLARRGQTLLDRQLQLIDELERDEPDPDRLQGFFRLDHLATRLRRNAETLLAVAGPEPARRWTRPVPVAGLLRAAIAEVDDYPRVDLLALDEVEVAGPAGVDLVHLLAELLDNAVAFSPPTARVSVTGTGDSDGYVIEVTDQGLGMADEELVVANQRLAGRGSTGRAAAALPDHDADRLGLVVAGRLAARHGIGIELARSPAGGVTAAVRLPTSLLSARPAATAVPGPQGHRS
jgi:signal transduction histidine kinase